MDRSMKLRLSSTDRLSQLPEEILYHILSFLPTKTSIATGVLSKRWQDLWTLVPILDFDMSRDVPYMDIHNFSQKLHFSNFVNNALLLHRHHPINIFRLDFPIGELTNYDDPIKRWFLAVSRRLQELELQVTGICFTFPREICFSNLLVLKLRNSFVGSVESGLFPKLKVLHLSNITFVDTMGGSLCDFLHACPVLEELRTHGWHGSEQGLMRRVIVAPTLTSLTVGFVPNSVELVLHTPVLEYLSLDHACCTDTLLASSLHNLRRADINCFMDEEEDEYTACGPHHVMRLLSQLSSIEFLKLSYGTMRAYDEDPMRQQHLLHVRGAKLSLYHDYYCVEQLPVFHNLVRFELCIPSCNYVLLPQLLLKFHNLQHIVVNKNLDIRVPEACWKEPLQVPICLSSTLLSLRIEDFEGFEAEVELVKYVMKHAMVLKDVTLNSASYFKLVKEPSSGSTILKERANAVQELPTVPRGSEACKLHLN